jgi:dolichol kinase
VRNQNINHISLTGEILRKLIHLFGLVIPCGYFVLRLSKGEALAIMIPISIIMVIIDIGRLRDWKIWHYLKGILSPIIREHETMGDFTGASYILVTSCLAIALFSKPVAIASLAFIMAGDPASAIIGRKFGRIKFRTKSLEGSLAFLVMALIVSFVTPHVPLAIGIIGAVIATITEAVSFEIDDNATVPLVSGLAMEILMRLAVFV